MTTIFLTGATGYLGAYVCRELLADPDVTLALLVRGESHRHALDKLWKAWQLHMDPAGFAKALERVIVVRGDLHAEGLGLSEAQRAMLTDRVDRILHIAATLNRKSSKACFNTNLRGTLSMIQLAKHLDARRGLERFDFVSTAAIAGKRDSEDLDEDAALDWSISDYDPYARTKKFCEHMIGELLPDLPTVIYRPSIVMGDGHRPETSQFDMIFATIMLSDLPVLPLDPDARVDIVNADWVGRAIATIHRKESPAHDVYHLSAGRDAVTVRLIADALGAHLGRTVRYAPALETGWKALYRTAHRFPRGTMAQGIGALWKVFWPYVTYDTVFLNDRAVAEVGERPVSFPTYFPALYDWVKAHDYRYPHAPFPEDLVETGR